MKKIKNLFTNKVLKNKKLWLLGGIIFLILLIIVFFGGKKDQEFVIETAKKIDLQQTILATGQVVSNTDLNLSFNSGGTVKAIHVKVGDKVKPRQLLANLEQGSVLADLTSARGALAAANAKLKKVLEQGEVSLAKVALEAAEANFLNTKNTQETLVNNAYNNLINSTLEATPEDIEDDYVAPIVSGVYSLEKEGQIKLSLYNSSGGVSFKTSGLVNDTGLVNSITAQPIGNSGLYITFPNGSTSNDEWVINIPNKKASNYLTNYNAYQNALKAEQTALDQARLLVDQRKIEYDLALSSATGSNIDLARADVLSAQGQVERAQAKYNDTVIVAPTEGTITSIDIKIGELAQPQKEAIILQDVSNIYLEANINEANITNVSLGLPIDITYDAFGTEKIFHGQVAKIDPSSTLVGGVVNYKITASVDQTEGLRPGMTANMTIIVKDKKDILAVPQRSLITDEDNQKKIRIITNNKKSNYEEIPVTTGMEGDGGLVEILSGLLEGDSYIVLVKKK